MKTTTKTRQVLRIVKVPTVPKEFQRADQAAFEMFVKGGDAVEAMRAAARWMRGKCQFTKQAPEPVRRGLNFWSEMLDDQAKKLLDARAIYTRED
jgi:hypothetical protein